MRVFIESVFIEINVRVFVSVYVYTVFRKRKSVKDVRLLAETVRSVPRVSDNNSQFEGYTASNLSHRLLCQDLNNDRSPGRQTSFVQERIDVPRFGTNSNSEHREAGAER